ncbi:MAG: PAS-domain containing protein [Idiomarina sp.]|nr:PAS-domain containing protein [Idiomarina sp.]
MLGVGSVLLVASLYLALLFTIASRGEGRVKAGPRPLRYTLALGVHCTTWAFYGTITQAAYYGWWFAPTYAGAILIFLFAHQIQLRMLRVIKRHNLTSIADFIATRYGKSQLLAGWIAIIALLALIPYIALQLRAVTASFATVTGFDASALPWFNDVSTLVALAMMGFAILFGARRLSLSEQHSGLMDAIAFESIVKLGAFLLVGLYVCYAMFDGISDLFVQAAQNTTTQQMLSGVPGGGYIFVTHMLLGALSMFVLPRQFQVTFIENTHEQELRTARWGFPLYLLAINFFILPIALAGGLLVPEASGTDTFMLALPIATDNTLITLTAFIGGLSAATSMVIMATLALSIMIANDLITPLWLRRHRKRSTGLATQHNQIPLTANRILTIRRSTIIAIIALAWGYHQLTEAGLPLVSNGVIAMALLIQLAPPMLGAILWSRGTLAGALAGLGVGSLSWGYWLLWPSVSLASPSLDIAVEMQLSQGIWLSLLLNLGVYLGVSLFTSATAGVQSKISGDRDYFTTTPNLNEMSWARLRALLAHFVGKSDVLALEQRLQTPLFTEPGDHAVPPTLVAKVERELAGAIGSAASRLVLDSLEQQPDVSINQVVNWATEASRLYKFNRELLQASVENIPQGISVIDDNMRLVAWNRRYLQMFDYPAQTIRAGMPVEELLRYNARRGLFGDKTDNSLEDEVQKRLGYLRQGSAYRYQRAHGERMIELQGNPMPEGGFVTTYTDITDLVAAQRELRKINLELEQRVAQRTEDLSAAKQAAEQAHASKTRFFAAASHDLMQPFNAATLLCDMLLQRLHDGDREIVTQVQQSLRNAEELLRMLLEITKLDAQSMHTRKSSVAVDDVFQNLRSTFAVVAADKGLNFKVVASNAVVHTDRKLLQRILQNLLSNAMRYTSAGKVLIGVRRSGECIDIQVHDTGPGIPQDKIAIIFDEFQQLEQHTDNPGLGLGLAIVDRMAKLLELPVSIQSKVGQGTCFSVRLPLVEYRQRRIVAPPLPTRTLNERFLANVHVLAVDNDSQVLAALSGILSQWGAQVSTLSSLAEVAQLQGEIAVMVVDYHLDHGETGVQVIRAVRQLYNRNIPAIVNSADNTESVREDVAAENLHFIPKPLKVAALQRLLKRLLSTQASS